MLQWKLPWLSPVSFYWILLTRNKWAFSHAYKLFWIQIPLFTLLLISHLQTPEASVCWLVRGTTQTLFKKSEKVRGERGERTSETCLKNQCWTVEPVTGCSAVMPVGLRGKRSHRSALPAGSCTWAGTAAPAAAAAGHVLRGTCEMLTWRKLQWTDGLQMVLARLGEKILSMFLPSCITLQDDNGTVVSILTESFFSWNLENTNSLNIQALLSILYKKMNVTVPLYFFTQSQNPT